MQVGTISELEPKPARNRQQQNQRPANGERYRNRGEKCQPLPEWHSQKHVSHQALRQLVLYLVGLDAVIQLGDFAERVSGKKPDPSGIWIRNPDENDGNIRIASGESSDALLIR